MNLIRIVAATACAISSLHPARTCDHPTSFPPGTRTFSKPSVVSSSPCVASTLPDGLIALEVLRSKTTRLTGSVFRASILLDGLVAPGSSPSRSMSAFTLCSNLELGDLIADGSSSHRSLSAFTLCNLELGDLIADGTRTVARVGPLAGALSP